MNEIAPGVLHWTAFRSTIGQDVHSLLDVATATVIDPMLPDGGTDALAAHAPARAVLTNRHHFRAAGELAARFGTTLLAHRDGFDDLRAHTDAPEPQPIQAGDEPAPGVRILAVGAITPEEIAVHLDRGAGVLAVGDVLRGDGDGDGGLAYMPDGLLGDDAARVRAEMTAALGRIVDSERFEVLALAHGAPVLTSGRDVLARFVERQRSATGA